ncbi:hypothetical protein MLD38_028984 [Melastoma candidum]|uniref:Uncharacterized protein n=1 Tax=Melastoma candidum TaxID=119954 RepID=A0ACB9N8C0_9MYRT|nr:hypothetical protein MLD38_028984 [Melastoma candidum]
MGMDDDLSSHSLILGLGLPPASGAPPRIREKAKPGRPLGRFDLDPCLTLALSRETACCEARERSPLYANRWGFEDESGGRCEGEDSHGAVPSFSSGRAVKREREASSGDDAENERVSSKASDEEEDLGGGGDRARKKLRLTKDQSALLEESFKQHVTLNPKQKHALARQLNLRPRQVEVWFQNRRARTKLKQTEADCEFLKKCCEKLNDANRRLQKELQELKALKLSQPLYTHVGGVATLAMCPSCERVRGGDKGPFSMAQATDHPQFHARRHQFPNPSTACLNLLAIPNHQ